MAGHFDRNGMYPRELEAGYREYRADPVFAGLRDATAAFVPGEGIGVTGKQRFRLAFVGEAPGAAEDRLRRPFVGPSGQLLNSMLRRIGVPREETFITNIVKYRPLRNRDPEDDEVVASLPYLREELRIVDPAYVVLLGRFAFSAFFPRRSLSTGHGQLQGGKYFPVYHPAYALRNAAGRVALREDFDTLKGLL
jgi:uracil-DNA glycosylase